ncbi:hypothetical protein GM921_15480 [Pedobacter sp. LMG 31464]|uniref:Alpha/beta hydrolase family protein n=1 Tax=Pedobacter planticolens TaxID=2679964 RepID=A0A923E1D6_9SPHI|nr:hypothetical protein [Pedobacter planticolens]MBB2146905.1 hypothetical protein [Pedobacter planticolens]
MKKLCLIILLAFITISIKAQFPPKIENPSQFGKDCFYYQILPKNGLPKGVLVLIPGYGEHPYSVSAQSTILQEAEKSNLAVMIVNLSKDNLEFPINEIAIDKLSKMIKYFYAGQKLSESTKLFIGGFSIGGTTALKFYAQKKNEFKINKVFAIDPPLDLVRLRKSLSKGRDKNLIAKLDTLNQSNKFSEKSLKELSVYNPDYTTIEMLPDYQQTSLRIYCEPDILWWIKNRNMDLSDMNVTDCAGYINKLLQKSQNQKVELILTKDRGFRNGTIKHPHSWSIAEPVSLVKWLMD